MTHNLNGLKTYIGAGIGLAGGLLPYASSVLPFVVPWYISIPVAVLGAGVAIYGRKHAGSKIVKAYHAGLSVGRGYVK